MLYFVLYNLAFPERGRPLPPFLFQYDLTCYSAKSFRMNRSKNTVFHRFFWSHKPFRMNTSKKSPQVFILSGLGKALSLLESALTKKGGGG